MTKSAWSKVFSAVLWLAPQGAWSCAVCMGREGSDLRRGFTWGISILLILPFLLFASIAAKVVLASRKKNTLTPAEPHDAR